MKITLCVEENKIECKESGSGIKAIYQIPHFDLIKQKNQKKSHRLRETENLKWMENYVQESSMSIYEHLSGTSTKVIPIEKT